MQINLLRAPNILFNQLLSFSFFLGAEGEKGRDYDFLNSVEVLIMDQAEIFLMQNWDHILSIFQAGFLLIF